MQLKFNCTKTPKCGKCSSTDNSHDSKLCKPLDSDYCCPNCNETHPAWSRKCSKYLFEKSICNYKVMNDVSYPAARKACTPLGGKTYANAAANKNAKIMCHTETNTILTIPPHNFIDHINFGPLTNAYLTLDNQKLKTRDTGSGPDNSNLSASGNSLNNELVRSKYQHRETRSIYLPGINININIKRARSLKKKQID